MEHLLGDKIGQGKTRVVYAHLKDKSLVIKRSRVKGGNKTNIKEYRIWEHYKETKYAKYLCECVGISPCGEYLLMKKAGKPTNILPARLPPEINTDIEGSKNWGDYKGRPVLVDYGNSKNYLNIFGDE